MSLSLSPAALDTMRRRAEESFYFFAKGPWGEDWLTAKFHRECCDFLQYDTHQYKMICIWRGSLKSTIARAYMAWRFLNQVNFSWLLIHQRYENAEAHLEKIVNKLKIGKSALLLQQMYADRIPEGWLGTNQKKLVLTKTDDHADDAVTIAGMDSKLESAHKSAILIDDPEGADADKSDVPNADARRLLDERVRPLLLDPVRGEVVMTLTPHGDNPTAWWVREQEGGTLENKRREKWGIFWLEILNAKGKSNWPERFPDWWCAREERLMAATAEGRRGWDMQYRLRKRSVSSSMFDIAKIRSNYYERGEGGQVILYHGEKSREIDVKTGDYLYVPVRRSVSMGALRYYLHGDPAHRDLADIKTRNYEPSKAAWIVVGVSPDFHVFVVETWIENAGLEGFAEQFIRLYRRWAPYRWTCEPIGAQVWFKAHIAALEKTRYRRIESSPRPWAPNPRPLPRPTTKYFEPPEGQKAIQGKVEYIIRQLEVPHNLGYLHLHPDLVELVRQHETVGSVTETKKAALDGLDALAQGPAVWEPPPDPKFIMQYRRRLEQGRLARGEELLPQPGVSGGRFEPNKPPKFRSAIA